MSLCRFQGANGRGKGDARCVPIDFPPFDFVHYNFCRIHQTLRVTPAMEMGLSDHVWELEELVALLD